MIEVLGLAAAPTCFRLTHRCAAVVACFADAAAAAVHALAGGIAVFDLRTRLLKWQQHLDLTTTKTKFTAHMFSSPTLVDLDADGAMEVVVGTSVGFLYVLDHKVGFRSA